MGLVEMGFLNLEFVIFTVTDDPEAKLALNP